jgi:hypothetical protein
MPVSPSHEDEARYRAWLAWAFERPVLAEGDMAAEGEDFAAAEADIARLIQWTCERCGEDLARYSDDAVRAGLQWLFYLYDSNAVFALKDAAVPAPLRLAAIGAIPALYRDCFASRCAPVMSHLNEPGGPLNIFCYMLWDVTPLAFWEDEEATIFYPAIADVLERCLAIDHIACIESALHGLGHIQAAVPELVQPRIARWLATRPNVPAALLDYAHAAAEGRVQ